MPTEETLTTQDINKILSKFFGDGRCEWEESECDKSRRFSILYRRPTPGIKHPFMATKNEIRTDGIVLRELSDRGIPLRVCQFHEGANAIRNGYGREREVQRVQ
jgi:hypothetical protein